MQTFQGTQLAGMESIFNQIFTLVPIFCVRVVYRDGTEFNGNIAAISRTEAVYLATHQRDETYLSCTCSLLQ